jgi:tetratricopeptide (TPR) repeat protein
MDSILYPIRHDCRSNSEQAFASSKENNMHTPKTPPPSRVLGENQRRSDSPSGSPDTFKFFDDESDAATMRRLLEKENHNSTLAVLNEPLDDVITPTTESSTKPLMSSTLSSEDRVVVLSSLNSLESCSVVLHIRPPEEDVTITPMIRLSQPKATQLQLQQRENPVDETSKSSSNIIHSKVAHSDTVYQESVGHECRALVPYEPPIIVAAREPSPPFRLYPSATPWPALRQARSVSIILNFLASVLPLLQSWMDQTVTRISNSDSKSVLLLTGSEPKTLIFNTRWMVLYHSQQTQPQPKRQLPNNELVLDPELQYGIALFQLLALKNQRIICEHKRGCCPKTHAQCLTLLVETLEFCINLRGESNAAPLRMELAQALDALGGLNRDNFRDFPQAFVYFTRALEVKSFIYGADAKNLDMAVSMETLGVLMRDRLGCISDSIRCFQEALTMKRRVYELCLPPRGSSRQWAELAQTYHSLGLAYDMSTDYQNAALYYDKALTARHKQQQSLSHKYAHTLGQDRRKQNALTKANQKRIATLFNMGCVAEKLNRLEDARAYMEEALQLQYQIHSVTSHYPDHEAQRNSDGSEISLIGTLFRLACIYEKCKETEGAYKYYRRALDIHVQTMQTPSNAKQSNMHHPLLIALLHGAATSSNLLGYYEDSLSAYESLIEALRLRGAADKRLLIPTLHHLGLLNDVLGHVQKASKYYRHALTLVEADVAWKESDVGHNIRMNILCLADPLSEAPRPNIHALNKDGQSRTGDKAKKQSVFDHVLQYFLDNIRRYYKRQDYVHKDAAMAITYRNTAMLCANRSRHLDARTYYEQYLETVWYHAFRENEDHSLPACIDGKTFANMLTSRCLVVSQALYALGISERKLRHYPAARHYQKEGIALINKAKKHELEQNGGCVSISPYEAKRRINVQSAVAKELQLLNGGCAWISFLVE